MSENDEATNLARRAFACSAWRDMAGMRNLHGFRLTEDEVANETRLGLPDLDDPATVTGRGVSRGR